MTEIDINKGMILEIVYQNGKKEAFPLASIAFSKKVVRKVNPGEILWGIFPEKESRDIYGKEYKNVESAVFVDVKEPIDRGWWHHVNENECERFWIETGIDSTTWRFVFRIERDKNNIIVYGFFP